MDATKKYVKPSPEESANFLSKLFYWWFLPFFKFGYKNDVQLKDIYNASKSDLSAPWGDELQKNWEKELKQNKKKANLKKVISSTFFKVYIISGLALFFQFVVIKMVLPIALASYIHYFDKSSSNPDINVGWMWACAVVVLAFLNVVLYHSANLSAQRVGMKVRVAVCSLVYRKLLKLSHISLGQTAAGQMVNYMSNDVQRFDLAAQFLHFIWILPINVCVAFYIMYTSVGWLAAFAGMGAIIIESIPLQGYLSRLQGKLRYKIALRTDKRVKLMNEITSGIQVIKMYAWEKPFEKMVELSRKLEINVIAKTSYIQGVLAAMSVFTERLTLYITVVTFVLVGKKISGDVVFSMAQLFNTIQLIMSIYFPRALSCYAEAKVSVRRLESFLLLEENEKKRIEDKITADDDIGDINLQNVTASWNPNPIVPTLVNLNLHIKPGQLCCVVGNVGSGKSSLLHLLLRELPATQGRVSISGKIAYASQEPWLFVSSIRKNILFGRPYVSKRYHEVVQVCSLQTDFKQFAYGDKSLVGERGSSLSGGQRARVNLARAVYTEADIYLLDDPLSAVDTKVARHLFDQCIGTYLKGKTRILVTHQLQFMKKADLIIMINNGGIEKVGSFDELSENDLHVLQQEKDEKKNVEKEKEEEKLEEIEIPLKKIDIFQSTTSLASSIALGDDPQESDELVARGSIKTDTYFQYWRAGCGICFLLFTVLMFVVAQVIANASDLWLTYWTNIEERRSLLSLKNSSESNDTLLSSVIPNVLNNTVTTEVPSLTANSSLLDVVTTLPLLTLENATTALPLNGTNNSDIKSQDFYILIYTALIVGSVLLLTFRSFLFFHICMIASKVLHNKMFSNVLQAPMRFFDTNPSGRILNRFSKDMGALDELLPRAMIDSIQIFMVLAGILIMIFIFSPWMIIPTILLGLLFYYFRVVYLISAQAIKRLEGTTRAPVFSHISASLYGMSTIRSANAEEMLIKEFDVLQDQHTSTWFLFIVSSTAFGFYLDIISTVFLAIVAFQFLIFQNENTMSGNVGLVISQSLILTGMLQFGVRQTAEVASNMVSVERVLQYTNLEKEGPFESLPTKKPPRGWPDKGRVVFKNTYLKYAHDLPPVLKNLNIEIKSAEKIGIVGRTGAGKSTLIASLFRLAPIEGTIAIDGVDSAEIGLNDLRLNISIIPQEPVLFSASLRYNLDPFEKHDDDVLWKALENVELKGAITDLNHAVSEGGSNFSAGQRQLICLARAIVRNNKVLVMDEATANVDPHTDALIQKTIRERFKNCTVLTIAHRLNTIMDCDRVLVMDAGQAMEFDHPHTLLQNPEGYFYKMVKETGPAMQEHLEKVARDAYNSKKELTRDNGPKSIEDKKDE